MTGMYKGLTDFCVGYCNSDIICVLRPSQIIHYCNQSLLVIVPELNIFVFSITISDLISRSALVRFSLLRASYLYHSIGAKVLHIWFVTSILSLLSPLSQLSALYYYYENTVLRFVQYRFVRIKYGYYREFFCSWPASCIPYRHRNVWVWLFMLRKIQSRLCHHYYCLFIYDNSVILF